EVINSINSLGKQKSIVVLLDQVTDPHNVGAIMRNAAAFSVDAVITTEHHAASESASMAKAASGAMDIVPFVRVGNLAETMNILKEHGYWCIGMDMLARVDVKTASMYDKIALVMGSEGKGMRRLTREHCDLLVKLEISEKMESLNVANAAAVALYILHQ
ncbi:MAG: 23S rRNA (guanosine(2251)-2'-O)-methyltransferase RlmB, partial [Rickettsiales bacterium]|nr:23S rRNA (guanosine(2251)-2'-O)-methyltransferase RlmB [Rickettsiales bacterium]